MIVHGGGDQLCTESGVEMAVELKRLAGSVFILLDSERKVEGGDAKAPREWFRAQMQRLDIRVHLTERRALENYFPDAAVQRAFGPDVKALKAFEPHDSGRWRKRENWRIVREITSDELEENDVVRFLREVVAKK